MILLGGSVIAKQLISLSGQLNVYIVVKVLASHILNMPEISAEMIWLVPFIHLTPTRLWLWPFSIKIFWVTWGFQMNTSWSEPALRMSELSAYQSREKTP
jgi:hypothetical protein